MLKFVRALMLSLSFLAVNAFAGTQAFDQATFDTVQKEGKPTLVMIHADWCPTCKAQAPLISELLSSPDYKAITALRVDFDHQKEVVKDFKATMQSTLIVFKNGKEVGRSTGETKKDGIAALLKKAI